MLKTLKLLTCTRDIALGCRRDREQATLECRALLGGDGGRPQRSKRISKTVPNLLGNAVGIVAVLSHERERRWRFASRVDVPQDRRMQRPPAVTIATVVTVVLALGCLALAVAHAGISLPLLSRLGPGGGNAVVPAAIAFSVATAVLALLAMGMWRRRAWAWAVGLVVHGVVLAGAAFPYRGWGSLVGIVLAGGAFMLLVSRPGREGLLYST